MAKAYQVLKMLCPNVEYIGRGESYEEINWLGQPAPITKKEFEDGFAKYDHWEAEQNANRDAARQAVLSKLDISEEEARILLG